MLSFVQRPLWWLARRIYKVERIGPLEFIDMRAHRDRDHGQMVATIEDALNSIKAAKGGFSEIVTDHLRFVAAMDVKRGEIQATVQGYVHPFAGPGRTNGQVLACRLVWVATCIRLERNAAAHEKPFNKEAIVRACNEAQRRFVEQFPNANEWIEYLESPP
jgi:hypothetical protein